MKARPVVVLRRVDPWQAWLFVVTIVLGLLPELLPRLLGQT
jgi:hypothetical protein